MDKGLLLTKEERNEVADNLPPNSTVGDERKAQCQAQLLKAQKHYKDLIDKEKITWIKALMKEGIAVAEPSDLAGVRKRLEEGEYERDRKDERGEIDYDALLDRCWSLLNRAYEESYGKGYHKPEFRITLTHEEIYALRSHVANLPSSKQRFISVNKQIIFGHELSEQRRTPYLEAIGGQKGED